MMKSFRTLAAADRRGPSRWLELLAGIVLLVIAVNALAQAPAASAGAAPPPAANELDALVGRIALYPDDLVGIILPASTNPLQLVQADRYLDKRKADPKLPVDDKWDDAVKSLLNYPDVVKMMSADLDWTSALGEAVVADQGDVLEAIQSFRRRAQAAGNLKSDGKQVVQVEKEIINIVPADPQVIYVPQYNPATIVVAGGYPWGYYPTPYPSYYYPYPPGAALAAGVVWGAAIGAAWGGNHYGCCGDANINVNRNTNINTGNINRGGASQLPAGGGSAWKSNKQPGQVSSSVGKTASAARPGDARAGAGAGSAGGGAGRASAQPAGVAMGGGAGSASRANAVSASARESAGGGAGRSGASGGGDALGGYGSGRQTQMDSSRGASSRGSMASASPTSRPTSGGGASASRSMQSGGGARAGGGGGGGARGGGGGRGGGGRR
jgi:hypothetical protein